MSVPGYPQFRIVTGVINVDGEHDDYDEVMQDVFIDKTGRYELLSETKTSVDPKSGWITAVVEVRDNGPKDDAEDVF